MYDSNDLTLNKMLLHRTTGVSTEDKDAEDEEYNENYEEVSYEVANKGTFFVCN